MVPGEEMWRRGGTLVATSRRSPPSGPWETAPKLPEPILPVIRYRPRRMGSVGFPSGVQSGRAQGERGEYGEVIAPDGGAVSAASARKRATIISAWSGKRRWYSGSAAV